MAPEQPSNENETTDDQSLLRLTQRHPVSETFAGKNIVEWQNTDEQ